MTSTYTIDQTTQQQTVAKINTFLQDATQQQLTVEQDDRWIGFGAGGLCILAGGSLIHRVFKR
jgi:hypothetical protein